MFKEIRFKTPSNSRRHLIKNNSFDSNNFSHNKKTIYKMHDRLFNSKILSIISKNNNNSSKNLANSGISTNNKNISRIKTFRLKSFDNQSILNFSQYKKQPQPKKIFHSTIEDYNNDNNIDKPRVSLILHKDSINKRDSMIFMPQSPTLSSRRGPKNKGKYTLINQIIKFNIKKKEEDKLKFSPMKLGKDYTDFIERKNKLFFNINYNSPYIHKMSSNYLIDNNFLNLPGLKAIKKKLKKRRKKDEEEEEEEELKQIEIEKKDKMEEMSIDLQHYKKSIKVFLTDETKLNQVAFHEEFFDSFVNKINFLYDGRRFPTIKNNLKKIVIEFGNVAAYEWNKLNMIEVSTLLYLHKLKVKIQRELDEIHEGNKEIQFKINRDIGKYNYSYKKRKKIKNKNSSKTKNEEKIEENKNNNENNDINQENNLEKEEEEEREDIFKDKEKENLYDLEEYFVHKGKDNKRIIFATGKIAYTVYHNPNFYRNYFPIKKKKDYHKKKKEYDIYL